MAKKAPQETLTGDAAWRAVKQQVADNNEAAHKRGREERAEREAQSFARQREADRRERATLPTQPRAK